MRILTVDVGTGTQDIFLYNSELEMENNFKLVLPSPTMIVHRKIKQATKRGESILLTGVTMGGGPSAWAAEAHLRARLMVFATPDAARTFNDDLEAVREMGVEVLSEDETRALPSSVQRISMQDFDFPLIASTFKSYEVDFTQLAAVVVGVFDHGNAPPGASDRKFRFDYLDERIRKLNRLSAFAYPAADVPASMTRLLCVVESGREINSPLVVMDTAPAAVLGAALDQKVAGRERVIIANVGNFHTLAFRLGQQGIEGLFEHHTGLINRDKLECLLKSLADGSLRGEDVFAEQGHGALLYDTQPLELGVGDYDVVITGPRRGMFQVSKGDGEQSHLVPYFAAPFGDMMITGCFGLLAATADVMPDLAGPIHASLSATSARGVAPWDVE